MKCRYLGTRRNLLQRFELLPIMDALLPPLHPWMSALFTFILLVCGPANTGFDEKEFFAL
jgi:hypothetical protein